jgi:hypothetical protein
VKAIAEYEAAKKKRTVELVPLRNVRNAARGT